MHKVIASIGIFDGVHLGHQKILKKLVEEAYKQKTKSLVITFYPHPREVLKQRSKIPLLTSLEHRLRLIKYFGVNSFFVVKFTKKFARMKAEDFIKKVLIDKLKIKNLIVGRNFLFGYKGKGDLRMLERFGNKYGFRVFCVRPIKIKGKYISSTRIRHAIEKGDLKKASAMLGRQVSVSGTVVKGRRFGRKLGFPTANIDPHHEAVPSSGVYAVDVCIGKKRYNAILNIGGRPTFFKDVDASIELHILNFNKNIYGRDVEIIFKRRIRSEKKFSSIEALRRQIERDITYCMEIQKAGIK